MPEVTGKRTVELTASKALLLPGSLSWRAPVKERLEISLVELSHSESVIGGVIVTAPTIKGAYANCNSVAVRFDFVASPNGREGVRPAPDPKPEPVRNSVRSITGIELSPWATFPLEKATTARMRTTAANEVGLCFNRRMKYGSLALKGSRRTTRELCTEKGNQKGF